MTRATIGRGVFATALVLVAVAAGYRVFRRSVEPAAPAAPTPLATPAPTGPAAKPAAPESYQGFLYGRVTLLDGTTYEGRLRWGVDEEAFWDDTFNGFKDENPWVAQVPPGRLPIGRPAIEILGIRIPHTERRMNASRPFMARFGDIGRIEARGTDVRVTLKSGTLFHLYRFDSSDFDDGLRVWDGSRGVVDLDNLKVRSVELLPTAPLDAGTFRLHGTVRTPQGEFTGFVQWDRQDGVGTDELDGRGAGGELSLRFDSIRSIARRSRDSVLVTQLDGREVVLSDSREVDRDNRGIYVDDPRYGRVLVSWDAFERLDFDGLGSGAAVDSGPAYGDFPPGRPLAGSVTTRDGRRLAGRLVYDLDESETTETLDGDAGDVGYIIPFGLVASVVPVEPDGRGARVVLRSGEELQLGHSGDVGPPNAGVLVFTGDRERPEYVRWEEIQRIDFDRPPAHR